MYQQKGGDYIKSRQPRKVSGFKPTTPFAHKPKVRRNANRITDLQDDQTLKMSPWDHLAVVSQKVDFTRANWKGFIVYSAIVYDPRPRLRKAGRDA